MDAILFFPSFFSRAIAVGICIRLERTAISVLFLSHKFAGRLSSDKRGLDTFACPRDSGIRQYVRVGTNIRLEEQAAVHEYCDISVNVHETGFIMERHVA